MTYGGTESTVITISHHSCLRSVTYRKHHKESSEKHSLKCPLLQPHIQYHARSNLAMVKIMVNVMMRVSATVSFQDWSLHGTGRVEDTEANVY